MVKATPTPTTRPTLRDLRDQVRALARDRGAMWLRPHLQAAGVDLVSKIPVARLRGIVAEA